MVRKPPTTGPKATAAPATAPHTANAFERSLPVKVVDRMASVAGSISDAPMPSMRLSPSRSVGTEVAIDARNEPTPNSAAPSVNIRRAP